MAAPVVVNDLEEAYKNIYINLHSLNESGAGASFFARLTTWRDSFFALVDPGDPRQGAIGPWAIPTSGALTKLFVSGSAIKDVDPLVNLIQNTLFATIFDGYVPPAAQEDAMVIAFNNAWT